VTRSFARILPVTDGAETGLALPFQAGVTATAPRLEVARNFVLAGAPFVLTVRPVANGAQ
jgi:hypothetical protein